MNEEIGGRLLQAYEATLGAFAAVESVSGGLDGFGNSSLLEVRNDLSHTAKRLRNMALLNGASPAAVETVGRMGT